MNTCLFVIWNTILIGMILYGLASVTNNTTLMYVSFGFILIGNFIYFSMLVILVFKVLCCLKEDQTNIQEEIHNEEP